jgi:SanA protein
MTLRRLIKFFFVLVALACVASAILYSYVVFKTQLYIDSAIEVPPSEVAMVLGASVTSTGILSPVLAERANKAVELYQTGKIKKILVTGDNGTVAHNEVDPVARYLNNLGIPKEDIFLDHAGFDTYSSMYRAREVFGVSDVTIVSQEFHLPRAVYIARELGLEAVGVSANQRGKMFVNYLREVPATIKAVYDLYFERQPKYLGETYDIAGDGRPTWGGATTTLLIWRE